MALKSAATKSWYEMSAEEQARTSEPVPEDASGNVSVDTPADTDVDAHVASTSTDSPDVTVMADPADRSEPTRGVLSDDVLSDDETRDADRPAVAPVTSDTQHDLNVVGPARGGVGVVTHEEREPGEDRSASVSADAGIARTAATVTRIGMRPALSVPVADAAEFPDTATLQPPQGVRRVVSSKRGKRDYNYSWPKEDLAVMRKTFQRYAPLYRRLWVGHDPEGNYRLTFSPFVARALQEAFKNPAAWLPTVRNDARKEPIAGGREQVGLVWPASVEEQVVDLWETLDRDLFPEGFSLTKQHLAAAAILEGLKTVEQWYPSVSNDDRFSIPVDNDGRLRENRAESVHRLP